MGTVQRSRLSALMIGAGVETGGVQGGSTRGRGTRTCSIERAVWSKDSGERVCLDLWLEKCGAGGEVSGIETGGNHLEGNAPPP